LTNSERGRQRETIGIDWTSIKVLSFDCYGTLIDWETGILNTVRPLLESHEVYSRDAELLELFAGFESNAEQPPFQNYKSVVRSVMAKFALHYRFQITEKERNCLIDSIKNWEPFADTLDALSALKKMFRLAIISNVDDDLFSSTERRLGIQFDWVITAEQVKSYKPSLQNFTMAVDRIGVPLNNIVHVAQSLFHDINPATQLGLHSVWVNRRKGQDGFGATMPALAIPEVVVPDLCSLVTHINERTKGKSA
jgi:2-haloacid dehalogenase